MDLHIRLVSKTDMDGLVQLTLLAFEPVFRSFAQILGEQIYPVIYPDWEKIQSDWVETLCKHKKYNVWVAEAGGRAVGLIAFELNENEKTGEVQFLAVHPKYQNVGIGTELNKLALQKMKEAGMEMAVVDTGGDESHAPARRSYEKAGYTPLPLVRFYKKL